jgi:hypothetical protein
VTDADLDALLKRVWIESQRNPLDMLRPKQISFVSNLELHLKMVAVRQGGQQQQQQQQQQHVGFNHSRDDHHQSTSLSLKVGMEATTRIDNTADKWLAYDDPMQDVLNAFDHAHQQELINEGESGKIGRKEHATDGNFLRGVVGAVVTGAANFTARKHPVQPWSLQPELGGPFSEACRPPHWDSLDGNWPREPGAPPPAADGALGSLSAQRRKKAQGRSEGKTT